MPNIVSSPADTVPLVRAAAALGRSYHVTLNLILTRKLEGFQDESGRWRVHRAALDALLAEAPGVRPTPQSATDAA